MKLIWLSCIVLLLLSGSACSVIIKPGVIFLVENARYQVSNPMNFEEITIDDEYIIFNDTGFFIDSENNITITLVYLSDIDEGKVLEFYANTTGLVWFNLSGFVEAVYDIKRNGQTIATVNGNVFGFISFSNNVWSNQLFEIYLVELIPDWDVNIDHSCNLLDLINIVFYYGMVGIPGWIRQDVDNNGIVQLLDLISVVNHYGETW